MTSNPELDWSFTVIILATLVIGIATVLVRRRLPHCWMVVTGAILFTVSALFSSAYLTCAMLKWDDICKNLQYLGRFNDLSHSAGLILFLLGIFLQSIRQAAESNRIADLEAILQDRQQNSDPR